MLGMVQMDLREVEELLQVRTVQMAQDQTHQVVHHLKFRKDPRDLLDQADRQMDLLVLVVSDHQLVLPPFRRCSMRTAP